MTHVLQRVVLLLCALQVWAQDATMVRRATVAYNTQRNTLALSETQRGEAARLAAEAQAAAAAGKYGEAMRLLRQGMAVMRKVAWTPAVELASAIEARVDRALIEPRGKAVVTLFALYPCGPAAAGSLTASVFLMPVEKQPSGAERSLAPRATLDPAKLPLSIPFSVPESAAGDYNIEVRLAGPDGWVPAAARSTFVKVVPVHVEALAADLARLRRRTADARFKGVRALLSAEYVVRLFERASSGDVNPHHYSFRNEIIWADSLMDAIEAGEDPFQGKRGDFRKAYRSKVDDTLQPYRVLVPASYDGKRSVPLVVALHGMGGDENSMLDGYKETLRTEAERLGFLVVCPKGRDPASMYRGAAEQDVLDVIAEVRRDYRVDASRIYLMGHSMGAYGTWSIAMRHPEVFAALGPIAGGGDPRGLGAIAHIPQYVVHGDNDKTVPVENSRVMVEASKKLGAKVLYVEVPGGGHGDVVAPEIGHMLDFFALQARREKTEGP